ncbi:Aminopeptidase 2 mitochondrial [Agyrium rufum]|nr:Aminopeptidase 2 mitochondrial [Agyrium rufum]
MCFPHSTKTRDDLGFLPKTILPRYYDLTLEPDLEGGTFLGEAQIDAKVLEETNCIALNSANLTIARVEVSTKKGGHQDLTSKTSYDEESEQLRINVGWMMPAGTSMIISISYKGSLEGGLAGFYRSKYKAETGEDRWIASTQFQPSDARRAFPCFDEPWMKALFSLTLVVDEKATCLFNMPLLSEFSRGDGKKVVTFGTTPKMSTYLVCFVIGYGFHKRVRHDWHVPVTAYTASAADAELSEWSLDVGVKCMKYFESILNYEYSLPKLDLISIPNSQGGAMENWGLVKFSTDSFLFDPKTSPPERKELYADVIAHELGHQWYSCLVTTAEWAATWLNEGFATYIAKLAMNHLYPESQIWDKFVVQDLQQGLKLDSLRESHAIQVPIRAGQEADVLDAIAYQKGAAVLRMLADYLGLETFLKGLDIYTKRFAYGAPKTDDLWKALSEASGLDVKAFGDPWTRKIGYPVISVGENQITGMVILSQHRFLRSADVTSDEDETLWQVPLHIKTASAVYDTAILKDRDAEIPLPLNFFKINADHAGFYRVAYTPQRLRSLAAVAKTGLLSVSDRAGLIADAGALSAGAYQRSIDFLELLNAMRDEDSLFVWREIVDTLSALRKAWIFEPQETQDLLDEFTRSLVSPKAHSLGWDFSRSDTNASRKQLKALLFTTAGMAGDKKIIKVALGMFRKYSGNRPGYVDPAVRLGVYTIAVRYGGTEEYLALKYSFAPSNKYWPIEPNDAIRNDCIAAIGCTRNDVLLEDAIKTYNLTDVVNPNIFSRVLPRGILTHPKGIVATWNWLKNDYDSIRGRMRKSLGGWYRFVQVCTQDLATFEQLDEVKSFFAGKDTFTFERSLKQAIDSIYINAQWVERDRAQIKEWLEEKLDLQNSVNIDEWGSLRITLHV